MRNLVLFFVTLLVCGGCAERLQTRSCSNGRPHPSYVVISGCSQMPCLLPRNTNVTVTMVYEAPYAAESLTFKQIVTALGVTIPVELSPERANACDRMLGTSCPLRPHEVVITTHTIIVMPIYPVVTMFVEFSAVDEQERTHICFIFDVQIVP
uniref:ML domain-containing protein n=1 Tax=Anopheles stephensi TaxID=30069 RepID=A0A182XYS7_ANOST